MNSTFDSFQYDSPLTQRDQAISTASNVGLPTLIHVNQMESNSSPAISKTIDDFLKTQHHLEITVARRKAQLEKYEVMYASDELPSNLKFKVEHYKQFPQTVNTDIRQNFETEADELLSVCRKNIFRKLIDVYKVDYVSLKEQVLKSPEEMFQSLMTKHFSHITEGQQHMVNVVKVTLNNKLFEKSHLEHVRAMQQPAAKAVVTSAPMAVDEGSQLVQILEQLKSLQLHNNTISTELKQLKSQMNSGKKESHPAPTRGRPKNGSGNGSDTTRPEKNHGAVPREGYHSKKRSKSTDSKRSNQSTKSTKKGGGQHQSTSRLSEQSQGKEQPREKSTAKPSTKKK